MDTQELTSVHDCSSQAVSSDRQVPPEIFSYQYGDTKNPKQSHHLNQTASTAPWERSQFLHFQGENCIRGAMSCSQHMTYPLMHREMCKAWRVRVLHLSFWTCVRTYWGMHVHTQRVCAGGMVMQWQEYHTYFPVRESLSLLWGRKTTSMTETQVHTQNKRRTWV